MKKWIYAFYALMAVLVSAVAYDRFVVGTGGSHDPVPLQAANVDMTDKESLQRGAKVFRDYCLSCHGLSSVRYNQLVKIGISEDDIKRQMVTNNGKAGDLMQVASRREDAAKWFGVPPPDLSLVASARNPDWIYTYLISFYRDDERPTGWNNALFPNVGMPHALWTEEGVKVPKFVEKEEHGEKVKVIEGYDMQRAGLLEKPEDYQRMAHDVTNFLAWASEPDQLSRKYIGFGVLAFLLILFFLARQLSKNYWKDIH